MNKPINVLFCLPSISRAGGGVSESARLQALALSEGGESAVSAIAFDDKHVERDAAGWKYVPFKTFRFFGPRSYSFSPGLLLRLFHERPDIVHVHGVWQFHCAAVYIWSLLTRRPYIVTPHGMLERWIRSRSPRLKSAVSRFYQDRFLKRAAAFHILTEKERVDVAEFLNGQSVEIIPNYVPPFVKDETLPAWWRPDYAGRDIYLFLGRIHEKKGCKELCDAWASLCAEDESFRARSVLVFCGWNDGLSGFDVRVSELEARYGNAIFAGPQYGEEKTRSLSVASFFLLPSKSEGLPMAILEAWSASIPVIMTDECNLPIGFERGAALRTGSDAAAIKTSLIEASRMPREDRALLAANGLALNQEVYSVSGVRTALLKLYANVLSPEKGTK